MRRFSNLRSDYPLIFTLAGPSYWGPLRHFRTACGFAPSNNRRFCSRSDVFGFVLQRLGSVQCRAWISATIGSQNSSYAHFWVSRDHRHQRLSAVIVLCLGTAAHRLSARHLTIVARECRLNLEAFVPLPGARVGHLCPIDGHTLDVRISAIVGSLEGYSAFPLRSSPAPYRAAFVPAFERPIRWQRVSVAARDFGHPTTDSQLRSGVGPAGGSRQPGVTFARSDHESQPTERNASCLKAEEL